MANIAELMLWLVVLYTTTTTTTVIITVYGQKPATPKSVYRPTYQIPVDPIGNLYGYTAQPAEAQWLTHPADPWSRPSMSPMLGWHGVAQGPHPRMIGTTYRVTRNYRLNYLNNLPLLRYMHHPSPTQMTQWNIHHRERDTLRYNPIPPKYFTFLELGSSSIGAPIPAAPSSSSSSSSSSSAVLLETKAKTNAGMPNAWPPPRARSEVDRANAAVMSRFFGTTNPGQATSLSQAPPMYIDNSLIVGASPDWLSRFHQYEANKASGQSAAAAAAAAFRPSTTTTTKRDLKEMRYQQLQTLARGRAALKRQHQQQQQQHRRAQQDDEGGEGPGADGEGANQEDVVSIGGKEPPVIDGKKYFTVYNLAAANAPHADALRMQVAEAAKFEAADTPNQRDYLWMPPSSHADVGQNAWPRYPRQETGY